MIVCQCVGVTDTTIRRLIADGACSIREVTCATGAGRCCAPCREEIAAMLYSSTATADDRAIEAAIPYVAHDGR
jgi:bacterioferritin-associated ferredoxin